MSKPTIIFIHGMWNTPDVWFNYQPRFEAAGFKTMAIALRHHDVKPGDPPPPGLGTTSLTDYADDVVELIKAQKTPPVLVGHSLGGLVAQLAAARTDVAAVVALTPAPPAGIMAIKLSVLKIFKRILFTWAIWRKPTFPKFEELRYGVFNNSSLEHARQMYEDVVWDSGRATVEIAHWIFDSKKASKVRTENIKCPVMIIGCALDRITPAVVCKQAAERYEPGKCEYVELPDHAHWVLGEDGWEEIADRCIEWIKAKIG